MSPGPRDVCFFFFFFFFSALEVYVCGLIEPVV